MRNMLRRMNIPGECALETNMHDIIASSSVRVFISKALGIFQCLNTFDSMCEIGCVKVS